MNLTAYFTNTGTPATGLSPVMSVWEIDGTVAVNSQPMTEIAGGFYVYDFSGYDYNKEYVIQAYESSLPTGEQYVVGSNDIDSQNTQGVVKQILGLVQSNFRMANQSYDGTGRLLSANIYTYENSSDATNDINRLHAYNVVATYDGDGNLNSYRVVEA